MFYDFAGFRQSFDFEDDATWVLTSSFVILTMQSGFAMLEMGTCSKGNDACAGWYIHPVIFQALRSGTPPLSIGKTIIFIIWKWAIFDSYIE